MKAIIKCPIPLKINKTTIVIHMIAYTFSIILFSHGYDVLRNILLKKLGMYDSIAEFQCGIEFTMGIFRVMIFGFLALTGLMCAGLELARIQNVVRIATQVSVVFIILMNICCLICEKWFVREGITED